MMQVALAVPQALAENAPIRQMKTSVDSAIKSRKIELILAALSSFNSPYLKKDIFSTPNFIKSVALIERMSPGGKLALARTLLEQL